MYIFYFNNYIINSLSFYVPNGLETNLIKNEFNNLLFNKFPQDQVTKACSAA